MPSSNVPSACLIVIGNEVLSGRTRDANLQYLGHGLNEVGIHMTEARVIADDEATIIATVNACRAAFDYVFTTGGIGPTHDDITSACIAKAFGLPLIRDPRAIEIMSRHYETPEDFTEARKKMTEMPEGAELILNPVSSAPGYRVENVYVMAGVPRIMQAMFDGIRHTLSGGAPMVSRTIIAYVPEGILAEPLGAVQDAHSSCEIGSYPFNRAGKFGASLVVRSRDAAAVDVAIGAVRSMVRDLGATPEEETA